MRIGSIVVRCYEFDRLVAFWQQALGYEPREPEEDGWVVLRDPEGRSPNVSLERIPEPLEPLGKTSRVHLDLPGGNRSKTGEPYTNAEVARMTLGDLSEEDVERIRAGALSDPSVGQVAALASGGPSLLDEELVQDLRDEDVRDITRESSRLPDRERRLIWGIVQQFRDQKVAPSG